MTATMQLSQTTRYLRERSGAFLSDLGDVVLAVLQNRTFWLVLAASCMLAGSVIPWVRIPLMDASSAWDIPVDPGWGVRSGAISYGALCTLMAAICILVVVRTGGVGVATGGRSLIAQRGQRPGVSTFVLLGSLAAGITLFYVFQILLADFARVAQWADAENQSLLIRYHLGYALPRQFRTLQPFQVNIDTMVDRLTLLVQVSTIGVLLPFVAGVLCFYGAWSLHRDEALSPATLASKPIPISRRLVWCAAVVLGCVVLGRAPLALALEQLGQDAVTSGDYTAAFDRFTWAERVNPTLHAFPPFRTLRGEVQYIENARTSTDAALFLASQYRAQRSYMLAWSEDFPLLQAHPDDPVVRHDALLTLERIIESSTSVSLTPVDDEAAFRNPIVILKTESVDSSLPWLDTVLRIDPTNVYGRYLRGRTLFTLHAYELSEQDFRAILSISQDAYMRSAAYTYEALCRGGLSDYAAERMLLQHALELDDGYYNTTARQASSGLH